MAGVKKGNLTAPGEWWKHLRALKRPFWKAERKAAKIAIHGETSLTSETHRVDSVGAPHLPPPPCGGEGKTSDGL